MQQLILVCQPIGLERKAKHVAPLRKLHMTLTNKVHRSSYSTYEGRVKQRNVCAYCLAHGGSNTRVDSAARPDAGNANFLTK